MMNYIKTTSGLLFLLAFMLFMSHGVIAKPKAGTQTQISFDKAGTQVQSTRTIVNIGNWVYWMLWDGQSGRNPLTGDSGGLYPRNQAVSLIFADGLMWGGVVDDPNAAVQLRAGGSTYISGADPGYIDASGSAVDAGQDSRIRIYRIRADFATLTENQVRQDAGELNGVAANAVTEAQIQAVLDQYEADWNEWPVDLGAPFNDDNGNGVYEPGLGETPGIANADQVVWFVANDFNSNTTNDFTGSPSMGIEYNVTAWSYNQPGASLGQIIFKKYEFRNKSAFNINDMYVGLWSDPDLGDFGDDLVGVDEDLSLGFVYNGFPEDGQYSAQGLAPAAAGYDFFQGPLVTGVAGQDLNNNGIDDAMDTGIVNLQRTEPGFVNLPMTSFVWFAAGSSISDPPLGDYNGTLGWYNLLRGFTPTFDVDNPTPYTVGSGPGQGTPTNFPLSGDPVVDPLGNDSDVDGHGDNLPPGDRRFVTNAGPFTLAAGESQEIVVALIGGLANDYLQSISAVRATDVVAQALFDDLFVSVPKAPREPDVAVTEFTNEVILSWGDNQERVAETEAVGTPTGYDFEGYNVYQLPNANASIAQGVKIATFDVANGVTRILGKQILPETGQEETITVQNGSDIGVKRFISIDTDAFTGQQLFPGNSYYFAVTAYNYNPAPALIEAQALESAAITLEAIPQTPKPGVRYTTDPGQTLDIDKSGVTSDGVVEATVVDPAALTGDSYEIFFEEYIVSITPVLDSLGNEIDKDTVIALGWNVRNLTTNEVIVSDQPQEVSLDASDAQPTFDGLQVKVTGPLPQMKAFQTVANAAGPIDPPVQGAFAFNSNGFPTHDGQPLTPGVNDRPDASRQQTNGSTWGIHTGGTTRSLYETFLARVLRNDNGTRAIPFDYEMRFTAAGGWANWAFETGNMGEVPFELWNIGINTPDDPSDDYRMVPWVLNDTGDGEEYNINASDHAVSGANNDPYMDWVYWRTPDDASPGDAGYQQFVTDGLAGTYDFGGAEVLARTVAVNWNGGVVDDPTFPANVDAVIPEEGTIFRIITNKPNTATDVFRFQSSPSVFTESVAEADLENINVYPNPYYAHNPAETNRFDRFVTFNHLPQRATLRIFTISGTLVRTLETDPTDDDQYLRWDLRNESNLPVASGLYVVHVDLPDFDMTKVLKVFIIQGEEILQFF